MKKKNVLMIALSLCLAAVIAVGGTLAYFTDNTDEKTNTFTTGNVNISLSDTSTDPKSESDPEGKGYAFSDVMPGDTLDKHVSVTVEDADLATGKAASSNAHVGILVKVTSSSTETPSAGDIYTLVDEAVTRQEGYDETNTWLPRQAIYETVEDKQVFSGYLYTYNPDAKTEWENGVPADTELKLFSDIEIPSSWTNAYATSTFTITVQAYAIQADNLEYTDLAEAVQGTLTDSEGNTVVFEQNA